MEPGADLGAHREVKERGGGQAEERAGRSFHSAGRLLTDRRLQREAAPAKINLDLHVGPPGEDGYHPISSLIVFADIGDELTLSRGFKDVEFALEGPFGGEIDADESNLVVRATNGLLSGLDNPPGGFRLTLDKRLPIASGLGGGSADAAAALRLLCRVFSLKVTETRLGKIARELGSDVNACLHGQPVIAAGRGDVLSPAPVLSPLHLVLANPRVASSTAAVYRAYDPSPATDDGPAPPRALASVAEAARYLRARRNDLEAPAMRLEPRIGDVLSALAAQPETILARMSGSGATCFALCEDRAGAIAVSTRLRRKHPDWWIVATKAGG